MRQSVTHPISRRDTHQLDLFALVLLCERGHVLSVVPVRFGKERRDHLSLNISPEDVGLVRNRLEEVISRPVDQTSGF